MKLRVASMLAVACLSLAACDGRSVAEDSAESGAEVAAEAPAPLPVQRDRVAAAEPSVPAFAAVYPGAEIVPSDEAEAPPSAGRNITFTTDATPSAVIDFYKHRAEAAGMAPVMAMSQGDTRAYRAAARGENGDSLAVVASPHADATSVQLTWTDAS